MYTYAPCHDICQKYENGVFYIYTPDIITATATQPDTEGKRLQSMLTGFVLSSTTCSFQFYLPQVFAITTHKRLMLTTRRIPFHLCKWMWTPPIPPNAPDTPQHPISTCRQVKINSVLCLGHLGNYWATRWWVLVVGSCRLWIECTN